MNARAEARKKRLIGTGALVFRDGHRETMHVHAQQGQLKWPSTGVASVRTPQGIFVAAASHAVWIPPGQEHGGMYTGEVYEQNLYASAERCTGLPARCCLVRMTARLARTLEEAVQEESGYARRSRAQDLAILDVLEHDVVDTGRPPLALQIPDNVRLRVFSETLLSQPGDPRKLEEWAHEMGMAERTLLRIFRRETGLSLREWKKRVRVLGALQRLCAGAGIAAVAEALGYESKSAFVHMFRATIGTTPARYYAHAPMR